MLFIIGVGQFQGLKSRFLSLGFFLMLFDLEERVGRGLGNGIHVVFLFLTVVLKTFLWSWKRICGLGNIFYVLETYLRSQKHICGLGNVFIFLETYFWSQKHICGLGNVFVVFETFLWSWKRFCGLGNPINVARNAFYYWRRPISRP